jgi:Ion channel
MIVLLAHFFGCGFHYVAISQIRHGSENTWLQDRSIDHSDATTRYIESFYFAFVTAATVGYGDVNIT